MAGKRTLSFLATVLAPVAVLVGFVLSGGQTSGAAASGAPGTTGDEGRRAALEFDGDRGTEFSGTCVADGERRKFRGEAPERLTFSPEDGRLECEVRKRGPGDLRLTFTAGESARSVQQIGSRASKTKIRYKDGGFSVSTTTSGGAGSSSQQTIVSSSSQFSRQTIVPASPR